MNAQIDSGGEPPEDGLGKRVRRVEERLTSVEERLTSVEERLTSVEERLTSVEVRLTSVEKRLTSVESDLAVIKSNYATREDLHREMSALMLKLVTFVCGFGTALVGATYFIAHALA